MTTWGLWSYPNHSLNPLDHTHTSSYIASYIASSLHHHSVYHMCMDIPAYMAGIGFQTRLYLFKSLIANTAGFFIMVINNQYNDWGFQSCFSAMTIVLSMDMIYFTMEGTVPSHCRLTTRHLGATLFKLGLHKIHKSHVAASMHHDTWALMQSHCLLTYWRPDSPHCNEATLGGCQLLLATIQGTQVLNPLYWKVRYSFGRLQSS